MHTTLADMVRDAVDDWYTRQMRDPWLKLYLCYVPSNGAQWGRLFIANEIEAGGGEIVLRMSPAWDKPRAHATVNKAARRLPVLSTEEGGE